MIASGIIKRGLNHNHGNASHRAYCWCDLFGIAVSIPLRNYLSGKNRIGEGFDWLGCLLCAGE